MDFYEVLGVSRNADTAVVSAAYRALARKYHPDANIETANVDEFRRITEAHETLTDPGLRAAYDNKLDMENVGIKSGVEQPTEVPIHVYPAVGQAQKSASFGDFAGSALWLLLGVPVCFFAGIMFAHIFLMWVISVFFDWTSSDTYSFSQAFESLKNILYSVFIRKADNDGSDPSILFTVFMTGWVFICSGAAASAVVSHTVENHPRTPAWLVYLGLLAVWCGYTYRHYLDVNANPSTLVIINSTAFILSMLAGIVYSRLELKKQRTVANSAYGSTNRSIAV